jgi:hypothetical protein
VSHPLVRGMFYRRGLWRFRPMQHRLTLSLLDPEFVDRSVAASSGHAEQLPDPGHAL